MPAIYVIPQINDYSLKGRINVDSSREIDKGKEIDRKKIE